MSHKSIEIKEHRNESVQEVRRGKRKSAEEKKEQLYIVSKIIKHLNKEEKDAANTKVINNLHYYKEL